MRSSTQQELIAALENPFRCPFKTCSSSPKCDAKDPRGRRILNLVHQSQPSGRNTRTGEIVGVPGCLARTPGQEYDCCKEAVRRGATIHKK